MTRPVPGPPSDPAKARFFILQLSRLGGLVAIGLGVLLWRTDSLGAPSPIAGKALFALGLLLFLVLPAVLRRRWRSPDAGNPR